jgi:hypothetical protein
MLPHGHSTTLRRVFSCWNWKCALLSAIARSLVYLAALRHSNLHGRLTVVLVEIAYVTLTAGAYAGMQQRALKLRSRLLGNLIVVVAVPGLAQVLDWVAHRVTSTGSIGRATVAVSFFASLSALFHLYIMRNGVFLTGEGSSLLDDFRQMPRLVVGFVAKPFVFLAGLSSRPAGAFESESA